MQIRVLGAIFIFNLSEEYFQQPTKRSTPGSPLGAGGWGGEGLRISVLIIHNSPRKAVVTTFKSFKSGMYARPSSSFSANCVTRESG